MRGKWIGAAILLAALLVVQTISSLTGAQVVVGGIMNGASEASDPCLVPASSEQTVTPVSASLLAPLGLHDPDDLAQAARNAAIIIRVGRELHVPDAGLVTALEVPMHESRLQADLDEAESNLDSAGLYQQRRWWGPLEDRMDPDKSTRMFLTGGQGGQRGLLDIPGWQLMGPAAAGQAVQVGPPAVVYARWESTARAVLAASAVGVRAPRSNQVAVPVVAVDPIDPCQPAAGGDRSIAGYANGHIPRALLCAPKTAPAALLRCDAAGKFDQMNRAFMASTRLGQSIGVTSSYRSYEDQVRVKAEKKNLAATPGKSNHGLGVALDLGYGAGWVRAHGEQYGWVHPPWARPGGSKPEPWHLEFSTP